MNPSEGAKVKCTRRGGGRKKEGREVEGGQRKKQPYRYDCFCFLSNPKMPVPVI